MSQLPLQGAASAQPWSLPRDTQLRAVLEAALNSLAPPGCISGGPVSVVSGYTLSIPAGSVFWCNGVAYVLAVDQTYNANTAPVLPDLSVAVYVWGTITRTEASQSDPTALDTYALTISTTLTNVAPSIDHFPVVILTNDASGITAIDPDPPGKWVRATNAPLTGQCDTIGPNQAAHVPAGQQVSIFDELVVAGSLTIGGKVRIS